MAWPVVVTSCKITLIGKLSSLCLSPWLCIKGSSPTSMPQRWDVLISSKQFRPDPGAEPEVRTVQTEYCVEEETWMDGGALQRSTGDLTLVSRQLPTELPWLLLQSGCGTWVPTEHLSHWEEWQLKAGCRCCPTPAVCTCCVLIFIWRLLQSPMSLLHKWQSLLKPVFTYSLTRVCLRLIVFASYCLPSLSASHSCWPFPRPNKSFLSFPVFYHKLLGDP